MKRHTEHAWTTATLVATAALAIALAIAAIFFTRANAASAPLPAEHAARQDLTRNQPVPVLLDGSTA